MPVRKMSAREMLGGKARVMFATPAMIAGFKKLEAQKAKTKKGKDEEGES